MQLESAVVVEPNQQRLEIRVTGAKALLRKEEPERTRLQAKLRKLQEEAGKIEMQGETLMNTVVDLRQLVKLVEKDRFEELESERRLNADRLERQKTLREGLKGSYESGRHLKCMGHFWDRFCG